MWHTERRGRWEKKSFIKRPAASHYFHTIFILERKKRLQLKKKKQALNCMQLPTLPISLNVKIIHLWLAQKSKLPGNTQLRNILSDQWQERPLIRWSNKCCSHMQMTPAVIRVLWVVVTPDRRGCFPRSSKKPLPPPSSGSAPYFFDNTWREATS